MKIPDQDVRTFGLSSLPHRGGALLRRRPRVNLEDMVCNRRFQTLLIAIAVPLVIWRLSSRPGAVETSFIYGIHDFEPSPGAFLSRLEAAGTRGSITATEAVGHNPADRSGKDYRGLANRGHRIIGRLNHGYFPNGTIPLRAQWGDFAKRCANFAAASPGCEAWVIGNETNLWGEWPADATGYHKYISPEDYAQCFRLVYDAIKAARPAHQVIPQALAPFAGPYGSAASHDGMPIDHVTYLRRMLEAIRASGGIDGVAVHINSRGYSRAEVFSTQKVNGNYWSFFCYKDWLERGIPSALWGLPVYATESNGYYFWKGGHSENPAKTYEAGWVQAVLLEIDRWNHNEAVVDGKPRIHAVNFYRWCTSCDGWNIDGAPQEGQILADLEQAASYKLAWGPAEEPPAAPVVFTIQRETPPLQKEEAPYYGVWRSFVFLVPGSKSQAANFELTGAAEAGADDDDARLLIDGDSPADAASWGTAQALDGARDQGRTATARMSRVLAPGRHVLRLQAEGTPFLDRIAIALPALSRFTRGDANGDRARDVSDAVFTLLYLFKGSPAPGCPDAADADDNGALQVGDAIFLLTYLFLQGPPPPAPQGCGVDPTADGLGECLPGC